MEAKTLDENGTADAAADAVDTRSFRLSIYERIVIPALQPPGRVPAETRLLWQMIRQRCVFSGEEQAIINMQNTPKGATWLDIADYSAEDLGLDDALLEAVLLAMERFGAPVDSDPTTARDRNLALEQRLRAHLRPAQEPETA